LQSAVSRYLLQTATVLLQSAVSRYVLQTATVLV
jgi:hypothetical protein